MVLSLLLLALVGATGGLLAGLLGIGGGLVFVPALYFALAKMAVPDPMLHAVATSLAASTLTGASSARAHALAQRVNWDSVRRMCVPIVLGAVVGACLVAGVLDAAQLRWTVAALMLAASALLLRPAAHKGYQGASREPGTLRSSIEIVTSVPIGVASAVMGVAGGTWLVPMQTAIGTPIHRAVATAAVSGVILAAVGALFMVLSTHGAAVKWFALAPLCVPSVLCAPLGAQLAHRLPAHLLRRVFAIFLALSSTAIIGGVD